MPLNCGIGEDSWRVPWTARRSNQSILKEISPEYSLEGLMLKLKLQFFGHLMQRTDLLEKTLVLRKIEGRRIRGWERMSRWMASLSQWSWVWANLEREWRTGKFGILQFMGSQTVRHDLVTKQQHWRVLLIRQNIIIRISMKTDFFWWWWCLFYSHCLISGT